MPATLPAFDDAGKLIEWLAGMRNDLEAPALVVQPAIRAVLRAIGDQPGCRLVRMSGSGATCFGLFLSEADAKAAAQSLHRAHPEWWVVGCVLADQFRRALPVVS